MKKLWMVLWAGLLAVSFARAEAPLRVGEDVIKQIESRHPYLRAESGRPEIVWSETLYYPNATYIAVHFQKFSLAPDDVLIVRSPDGLQSYEYRGLGRGKMGLSPEGFWATHIKGERAVLELISAGKETGFGFVIDRYARGFQRDEMEFRGLVSPESICGTDDALPAICFQASEPMIYDRSRAIARLLSGGSAFCTGWLVGNAGQLFTNNHCVSTNAAAISTDYEFMAQGATCGTVCGPDACPGTIVDGASMVQTNATLDYTLIQLATNPTPTYGFLQLRTTGAVLDERIYVVGHPNGEGKQIVSASTDARNPSGFCEMDSISAAPCVSGSAFPDLGYTCDTEPGSSGSAVLGYSDHKVVSLHHCGGCPTDLNTGLDIVDIIADLTAAGNLPPGSTFDPVGRVRLNQDAYGCSQTLGIELFDDNLINAGTQMVAIHSTTEPVDENVLLTETPAGSGKFVGTIAATGAAPVHGDSLLSVASGDAILVTYIDATDGAGGTNIPRTDGATVDCVAPVISNVQITDIQGSSAVVRFNTNEPADTRADYGLATAPPPGSTVSSANKVTVHAILLTGIVPCNNYIVRVAATDAQGNTATDNNGGAYYQFNSGISSSPTYAATGLPVAIPTASPTPTVANIVVPDNKTVVDVNVKVNLTHSYDGDMVISLRHPDGTAVMLSNKRGGAGDNYTNTIFDDSAATAIASGAAPFTGSFIPDEPLSAFNGKNAAGTWKLEVFDNVSGDGGSLLGAEITLVYPAQSCGPDASYETSSLLSDTCPAGGPGSGNGFWDDGEEASFRISLRNTGTTTLTGITATVTPLTAGVSVVDDTASYADLAPDSVAASQAPDFRLALAPGFTCGNPVNLSVQIQANEGTFSDTFSVGFAGHVVAASGTALFEDFAGGIPASWTVTDGGSGGGPAATWTAANPGARVPAAPMALPFVIVDSDAAGSAATQDETLASPVIDLSFAATVSLEFDHYFKVYSLGGAEKGDVDVRSTATGGLWVNVLRLTADTANPEHKTIDITAQTAGAADAQFRFHYYGGAYDWYWLVDNVRVSYTGVPSCSLQSCAALSPPGEVASVFWSAPDTLAWTSAAGATSYNVYQGTDAELPLLLTGDPDSCLFGSSAGTSLGGVSATPPSGSLFWWLVRGSNLAGEGPPGTSSAGTRVVDPSGPCQ